MALEMKASCEHCGRGLVPSSADAFICSYECTFCAGCASSLDRICPNCRGRLEKRPPRVTADEVDIESPR